MMRKKMSSGARTALTTDDVQWLEMLRTSQIAAWEIYMARRAGLDADDVAELAGNALIEVNGKFIPASKVVNSIVSGVKNYLVWELWVFDCATATHYAARALRHSDAEILLIAAGYFDVCLDELENSSRKAVTAARMELYGHP
jgi:hypothetical protein